MPVATAIQREDQIARPPLLGRRRRQRHPAVYNVIPGIVPWAIGLCPRPGIAYIRAGPEIRPAAAAAETTATILWRPKTKDQDQLTDVDVLTCSLN